VCEPRAATLNSPSAHGVLVGIFRLTPTLKSGGYSREDYRVGECNEHKMYS
jgi:hypothetical protein